MTARQNPAGILYIVATPIGNLADISMRAIDTLRSVDLIAAEDTRTSKKLFSRFNIKTARTSYHDHNEKSKAPKIIDAILEGKSVALISDAGTPLISDPGYTLVNLAIAERIDIIPVPGPSAILAALVASGFPTDRFCFEGYPPRTEGKLKRFFERLVDEPRTIVLFETPHRIKKCLKVMLDVFDDREIFIGRELTKKFEEKWRGTISVVLKNIEDRTIKGEIIVVVRGYKNR
jgi:16S rRNA (cytidine1402-2'-O)-methyltransferase